MATDAWTPAPSSRQAQVDDRSAPTPRRRKRSKRYTETEEFGRAVERMLRAYGARVGMADMEDLRQLVTLRDLLDEITADAVDRLRWTGYSWADVGAAMGVTRQAAQQRWGTPREARQS